MPGGASSATRADASHLMQCMEVWGGNVATNNGVVMPGVDAWVYARPLEPDKGGGDLYYVSSCATGRITRLLVADVSGHGPSVAEVAVDLRDLMRRYINFHDQRRFVERVNAEFELARGDGLFATAVVATLWGPTGDASISNAGHPRPMRYSARDESWSRVVVGDDDHLDAPELSNLPLGVVGPARYDEEQFRLGPEDLLLFYTDSLIERRLPDGSMLGEAGVLRLLEDLDPQSPQTLIDNLRRALENASPDRQADDLTLLLIRRNALAQRRGVRDALRAMATFVGDLWRGLTTRRGRRTIGWPQISLANVGGAFLSRFNRRYRRAASRAESHERDPAR
ncbi:MAG: serine/threonine-protein phosphatase [Phycisphaeraceae bacterium]|nr:serine/threonine-protein phosphatase [Phycisphaeraceae bacterium]